MLLAVSTMIACRNQEPRDTESGQGDNFDRNHPMETEGGQAPETDTTGNAPTQTSPTNN